MAIHQLPPRGSYRYETRGSGQSSHDNGPQESCSRCIRHVGSNRGAQISSHVRDAPPKRPVALLAVHVAPAARADWPVAVFADPSLAVVPVSGAWPLVVALVLLTCSPASVSFPAPVGPYLAVPPVSVASPLVSVASPLVAFQAEPSALVFAAYPLVAAPAVRTSDQWFTEEAELPGK